MVAGVLPHPYPWAAGSHLPPGGGLSQAPWGLSPELSLPALMALDGKGVVLRGRAKGWCKKSSIRRVLAVCPLNMCLRELCFYRDSARVDATESVLVS